MRVLCAFHSRFQACWQADLLSDFHGNGNGPGREKNLNNLAYFALLAVCIAICAHAGWLFRNGRRSRTWPFVPGTITTSNTTLGPGGRSMLVLEYSYVVDGHEHSGSRIAMAPSGWFTLGSTAQLLQKYPKRAQVSVFYDPTNPAVCTLETGPPRRLWSYYAIAGMFAVIAVVLVLGRLVN